PHDRPPASRPQGGPQGGGHLGRRRGGGSGTGVVGQPRQAPRRVDRGAAHRPDVVDQAGNDAAEQGHEQQQVDGGEPGRRVDVEPAQPVHHRRQSRVVAEPGVDVLRVDPPLGEDGAGHGRERQQEQQHQRGAHAGQLAPRVAQPGHQPHHHRFRAAGHQIPTLPTPTWPRSHSRNPSQAPVSNARPTRMSNAAPARVTHAPWRRMAASAPTNQRSPSPNASNGAPMPAVYAAASTAARPVSPPSAPRARTAASVGPTHGIHDRANTAPKTGAPTRPAVGSQRSRTSRCRPGTSPSSASPKTIMRMPPPVSSSRRCSARALPAAAASTPVVTKTAPNPATNSRPPASTRPLTRGAVATPVAVAAAGVAVPAASRPPGGRTASSSAPDRPVT